MPSRNLSTFAAILKILHSHCIAIPVRTPPAFFWSRGLYSGYLFEAIPRPIPQHPTPDSISFGALIADLHPIVDFKSPELRYWKYNLPCSKWLLI